MDIVLFGIQGSGKGTLGKAAAAKFGFKYFEAGHELRKLSHEDSELGQKVKEIISAGHLVSNEVVMEIIENFMKDVSSDTVVIFDGIPRKKTQAETFNALMEKLGRSFKGILVDVPEDEAIKRLSSRRICIKCKEVHPAAYTKDECKNCGGELISRSDDNPESIKTRIQAYYDETMPVIEQYKEEGKLITMDGDKSIDDARVDIYEIIDNLS